MAWRLQLLLFGITFGIVFSGYLNDKEEQQQPSTEPSVAPFNGNGAYVGNIWLYTMVATDYGGDQLLRHFIEYYHSMGIPYDRFIFVLHHNPAYPDTFDSNFQRCVRFLRKHNFEFRNWADQWSSARAAVKFMETALEIVNNPESWIIRLDVDELLDTQGMHIRDLISEAERENATFIEGSVVDRLHPEGQLLPIQPEPHILQQLTMECRVLEKIAGPPQRIVAFKAFLRPDDDNRRIIPPQHARAHFSSCIGEESLSLKAGIYKDCFGSEGSESVKLTGSYHLTPYALYPHRYAAIGWRDLPGALQPWAARPFSRRFTVFHVKWHAGLMPNIRDRAAWYRGDCDVMGVNEKCTPRHADWRQAVDVFLMLIDPEAGGNPRIPCQPGTVMHHAPL